MANTRASVFGDSQDIDLSGFMPKPKTDTKGPAAEDVRVVAEKASFRSREATPKTAAPRSKRVARRYRTGRNVQFNVKALGETVDTFYEIAEAQGWVLGYTLERAISALKRELESPT